MKLRLVIACTWIAIGLAGLVAGCSSDNESSGPKGSLAVAMGATRASSTSGVRAAAVTADQGDALSHVRGAVITIAGLEARMADGTWVPVETGLPVDVDLIALMDAGNVATLPADLLPASSYDALQVRITKVLLTLLDGTNVALAPGNGWTVLVPVSFSVVAGQATTVKVTIHGPSSFKFFEGDFSFDPDFDVQGVEHN